MVYAVSTTHILHSSEENANENPLPGICGGEYSLKPCYNEHQRFNEANCDDSV
jgi:hypothetical protein